MECAICYEKFVKPMNKEELETMLNSYDGGILKFKNLLITTRHNTTHTCPTLNCNCIICGDCWFKLTRTNKSSVSNIYEYFKCPYCRQIDWKEYMSKFVLIDLKKLTNNEEFSNEFFEDFFEEFFEEFFEDFFEDLREQTIMDMINIISIDM